MIKFLSRLVKERRGAAGIEYGLVLALIFLAIMGSVHAVANGTMSLWQNMADKVSAVIS